MASIGISTITAAIAALNIAGVIIYDLGEAPDEIDTRASSVLMPDPDGFVTELAITDVTYGYNAAE